MRMIHLRFENAGVFPDPSLLYGFKDQNEKKLAVKNWAYSKEEKKYCHQVTGSKNFANPVTVNIVANVLRALANDIPVPTLKPTNIAKNPIYEELASNAYVRYDLPMVDEKGHPMFLEYITTNKSHVKNSHQKVSQEFELFDGTKINVSGCYNWHYFDKTFENGNLINKDSLLAFIGKTLGIDKSDVQQKYTFVGIVKELSKYWKDKAFQDKVLDFFTKNYTNNAIRTSWAVVFFGCYYNSKAKTLSMNVFDIPKDKLPKIDSIITGKNTDHASETPLLFTRGIGLVRYVDGDIYCPVNDAMVDAISDGERTATILDGGLVYIVEIENCDTEWLKMNGYTKVLTLEEALKIGN